MKNKEILRKSIFRCCLVRIFVKKSYIVWRQIYQNRLEYIVTIQKTVPQTNEKRLKKN
jgi:hypothetical protein